MRFNLGKIKYSISHRLPVLRIPKRVLYAMSYYNKKYVQIFKWGFRSKETANYTYDLTDANILYLAQTISVVTQVESGKIIEYINEARNNSLLKDHIINETMKTPLKEYADLRVDFGRRLGWLETADRHIGRQDPARWRRCLRDQSRNLRARHRESRRRRIP